MEHGNQRNGDLKGRVPAWLVAAAILVMAQVGSPTCCAAETTITFNIPAGNAAHALVEFAKQSNLQPLFLYTAPFALLKTRSVVGEFEPAEALALLLKGTPLTFQFEDDLLVAIRGPAEWDVLPPSVASVD